MPEKYFLSLEEGGGIGYELDAFFECVNINTSSCLSYERNGKVYNICLSKFLEKIYNENEFDKYHNFTRQTYNNLIINLSISSNYAPLLKSKYLYYFIPSSTVKVHILDIFTELTQLRLKLNIL